MGAADVQHAGANHQISAWGGRVIGVGPMDDTQSWRVRGQILW
jgi:hypothetical protein